MTSDCPAYFSGEQRKPIIWRCSFCSCDVGRWHLRVKSTIYRCTSWDDAMELFEWIRLMQLHGIAEGF